MRDYFNNIFTDIDKNIKLDEEQINAIIDDNQNVIVVAGAGAGKTTVISAKIKYMVEKLKINPKDILIISFTNKATEELKERINYQFDIPIDISTFHSFAYKIVREFDKNYKICDSKLVMRKLILSDSNTSNMMKLVKKDKVYKSAMKKFNSEKEFFINYTVENLCLYKMGYSNDLSKSSYCKYYEYLSNILLNYGKYIEKSKCVDFEDIINIAASKIKYLKSVYKYVIVDEFQDISLNRYNLLRIMNSLYNSCIFVVGDDWQAIYSFAGSDLSLFFKFKTEMNASLYKITNTYRNSSQLIDVAGNFVMKNKKQIVKNLYSNKSLNYPVRIYLYKKDICSIFESILKELILEYGRDKSILVLGRFKKDFDKISDVFNYYRNIKKIKIDYLTVHSSKGLGYDNVILINGENGEFGFPCSKNEPVIRRELLPKEERIYEERRLFYVALTRTKNCIYILSYKKNKSDFVKELLSYSHVKVFK